MGGGVIHKALADAAVSGHVVADLGQRVWQPTLLNASGKMGGAPKE